MHLGLINDIEMKITRTLCGFAFLAARRVHAKCHRFDPVGDRFDALSQTFRTSYAHFCAQPGIGFAPATQFSYNCHSNESCTMTGSKGKLPVKTTLNITLESPSDQDDLFKIISLATGLATESWKKASNEVNASNFDWCVPKGTGLYTIASVEASCINGTLEDCDNSNPRNGTPVKACVPKVEDLAGTQTILFINSAQNVTFAETSNISPDFLRSAAAKPSIGAVTLVLEIGVFLSMSWMAL